MKKTHWLKGKQYICIKSAADKGDNLAFKILSDQLSGDISDQTFQDEVNAFFENRKGDAFLHNPKEGNAESISGKYTHEERYAFGTAEYDMYLSKKKEAYKKRLFELIDEKDANEYMESVSMHAKELMDDSGNVAVSISEEQVKDAIKFFNENPNFDITGKGGNASEIAHERECFLLLGPAGSGKTYLAKNADSMRDFVNTAISFDPDKYRNADPRYSGVANRGKQDLQGRERYGLDESWNEAKGHDYKWNYATQGTQKAVMGKWDKPGTMFGDAVSKGSNFIYQMVGDNDRKVTDMVSGLVEKGYKVHIVQNELSEGLERVAVNSAQRYKGGEGRMVDYQVTMDGFKSAMTFAKCLKMFKGNAGVDMMMNRVMGRTQKEGKEIAGNKLGSKEVHYGK